MRSVWTAYRKGLKIISHRKRIWAIFYVVNLLTALFLALPFQAYIAEVAGQSAALSYDFGRFDFTFLGDLMNQYGDGIWVIINQSKYIILLYLIVGVFLNGGLIGCIVHRDKSDQPSFFHDCGYYFWRLLRLSLLFFLIYIIIISLSWLFFRAMIGGLSPFNWSSDGLLIRSYYIVIAFMLLSFFISMMIHDYAKISLVQSDSMSVWKALKNGFHFVLTHIMACSTLYVVNLASFIVLFLVYRYLRCLLPIHSLWAVLALFLLGQVFIWFRIGIKIQNLASAASLTSIHKQRGRESFS